MTTGGQRRAAAEVLAKANTKTARCRLVLDGDLLDRHAQLEVDLASASDDEKQLLAAEILALEDEIAEAEVEFVLRGMGRARWRKLLADHAPQEGQAAGDHYDEDFPLEALAVSLVEPEMTVDEVRQLEDTMDEIQFSTLWAACLKANLGSAVTRPESQAARAIAANGRPRSVPRSGSESAAAS